MIEDGAVVAAVLVAERASNPPFADAGWADDEQILVPCDPLAGNEVLEQRPVEAARGFVVDVLDDSGLAQAGGLEVGVRGACFSRSIASRSIIMARRSSKGSVATSGWRRWSSSALAMPVSPSAIRRSWVGVGSQASFPPVLSGSSHGRGCCRAGSAGLPVAAPRGMPSRPCLWIEAMEP